MQQTKKVAIAKFTIHQREHLCALRPLNDMLVLESMFWHLQLREREVVEKEQIEEEELCVAKELVERLSRKFEPNQYHDEYTEAFKELVQRKLKGLPPKQEEPTQPQRVQDLLGALKQSLESVNSGLM
jgi:DNA end-binding protein Ku